ncbi:hypothetical protein [Methyloraptor flagellatus]|jgi:peptidoglycan hydrolase CwlO-like protein|uniref:Uncharacterized protein n=1 Tax=Methyloraptor flagellatus TaxID=3162530 RepID=A0AAU7XGY9_9HYPH
MSEVTDLVMPVLKRVQSDIADIRTSQQGLETKVDRLAERMDVIEGSFTSTMGITAQHKIDIATLQAQVKELTARMPPTGAKP